MTNKDSFLLSIEESKKKIKEIEIDNLTKQIKKRGSLLSEKKVEKKVNQILLNLDKVKAHINTKNTHQDKMPFDNSEILNAYAKYTLKWGFDIFLVFRDVQTQLFYACKNNKES